MIQQEILLLANLASCDPGDIQQFVAGIGVVGSIEFDVPKEHCAVVVSVEDFNVDESFPHTLSRTVSGNLITEVQPATWGMGQDVFYVFPPGMAKLTIVATPKGGYEYTARAVGYFLPLRCYKRISRMGTRIVG